MPSPERRAWRTLGEALRVLGQVLATWEETNERPVSDPRSYGLS